MTNDKKTRWVESGGGPILMLDRLLLSDWGGSVKGVDWHDYDRAKGNTT